MSPRFAEVTTRFWTRHGIRRVGSWTIESGNHNRRLYYILAWGAPFREDQRGKRNEILAAFMFG